MRAEQESGMLRQQMGACSAVDTDTCCDDGQAGSRVEQAGWMQCQDGVESCTLIMIYLLTQS